MKKILLASVLVAFSMPALAADEFYVVQNVKTKKCTVVTRKPTTTTATVVGGDGKVYTTRVEAQNAMKTETVCTSN